jgi:hypothetical protein
MKHERTADIHERFMQTGPARHEEKKNVVTTREDYDRFFDGYDAQLKQIVENTPKEVKAFEPDASSAEIETFAAQKAEDFSHFLDRIVTIGGETERAFANFKDELAPPDQDRIEQHINPLSLIASTDTAYHQAFYRYAPPDTLTQAQKDAYELANKRMREPLFKHSLQTLTTYLEGRETLTDEEKKADPRFQKEHAKTILKRLTEIATQTKPVDLDRCHDLLAFAANNQTVMEEFAPDWRQTTLYPLAEQIIKAGHIAAQRAQNDSPPETRGAGMADAKRVNQCADLFIPLLRQEIEGATTLSALSAWHRLDLAQTNARPKGVPPPRYLRGLESLAKERTNHLLQEKGLNKEVLEAWKISQKPEEMGEYFTKNFQTIEELEVAAPGAAKALHAEFGIQNFARQSLAFWVKQYQERDNHTTPYGVLLSPGDDWNGAFSDGHVAKLVDQAVGQLNGQALLRVIECRNKIDAVRKLLNLKQRYQVPEGGHAMSFAVIAGHGSKNSIHIGQREAPPTAALDEAPPLYASEIGPPPLDKVAPTNLDVITPNDILGPGMQRLKTLFRSDAPIVLISCSTGKAGGIGEKMSDIYDADVTAPTIDSYTEAWAFTIGPEGKIAIKATYASKETGSDPLNTAFYERNRSSEPPPL